MANVTVYKMGGIEIQVTKDTLHVYSDQVNLILDKKEATELRDAINKGLEGLNG